MYRRIAGLALLILAGCGTERAYVGPDRSSADVGLIVGSPAVTAGLPIKAVIRMIDGRVVRWGNSRVSVLPGAHDVLVDCVMPGHSTVRFPMTLDVYAGHRYVLRPQSAPGNRTCAAVTVDEE